VSTLLSNAAVKRKKEPQGKKTGQARANETGQKGKEQKIWKKNNVKNYSGH
jgi:hypothetical protein